MTPRKRKSQPVRQPELAINFSYEHIPTVLKFSESDAFIRGLMGPFGSGKSSGCVWEIIQRALAQKPGPDGIRRSRWAVVRNTYRELEDTTIQTFMEWFPHRYFGKYQETKHNYTISGIPDCEIQVWFRALDKPQDIQKLLSAEYTGAWVNEAREVPKAIIKGLMGRVRRFPGPNLGGATWGGIFMDTNPPDEDSWWYEFFEEGDDELYKELKSSLMAMGIKQDPWAIFKQPSGRSKDGENLPNLPKGYYQLMLSDPENDENWIRVYVDGKYGFVMEGKPVYPTYNDNIHCSEKSLKVYKDVDIIRGWDFGLTPACVFLQQDPVNGQIRVFDEICAEDAGIERFSRVVKQYCNEHYSNYRFKDYGDPAGKNRSETDETKSCFQILRGKGIKIRPGRQTLALRLESVRKALSILDHVPGFVIDKRCKVLRKGFQGKYMYKRKYVRAGRAYDRFSDKPDKNQWSHPQDALQYPLTIIMAPLLRDDSKGLQVNRGDKFSRPLQVGMGYDPLQSADQPQTVQTVQYNPFDSIEHVI